MVQRPGSEESPVRRFVEKDIPQVADLHRSVFKVGDTNGVFTERQGPSRQLMEAYENYFGEVFLNGPWQDDRIGSLVYEDTRGRVIGFLGVAPRQMLLYGEPVQMAVCSQYIVHPQRRGLVGLHLLNALFQGPQDLSVTDEANDASCRIWEARGGSTCPLYSIHWKRPLRPLQFALSLLKKEKWLGRLARGCAPLAPVLDSLAATWKEMPFRPPSPRLRGEDLDEPALLALFSEFTADRAFRPQYDERSFKWTLERAGLRKRSGRFYMVAVRGGDQQIAGWYIYQIGSSAVGEVLQIAARHRSINNVFAHLVHHAWQQGAIALSGRSDPLLIKELSDKCCLFHCRRPAMLIHTKKPELLRAIYGGDAFLSRLEGEWCLRFRRDW